MAALSDHDRRDAEHALRAELAIQLQRYLRRMHELGKTHIKEALDAAARNGDEVDGTALGRAAAAAAIGAYFFPDPGEAVEGSATRRLAA